MSTIVKRDVAWLPPPVNAKMAVKAPVKGLPPCPARAAGSPATVPPVPPTAPVRGVVNSISERIKYPPLPERSYRIILIDPSAPKKHPKQCDTKVRGTIKNGVVLRGVEWITFLEERYIYWKQQGEIEKANNLRDTLADCKARYRKEMEKVARDDQKRKKKNNRVRRKRRRKGYISFAPLPDDIFA